MINCYNRAQVFKAVLYVVVGIFCCWLTYLFFRYLPSFVAARFSYKIPTIAAILAGAFGLVVAAFSGYQVWRKRGGLMSYHESAFYHDFGGDTAYSTVADYYAHRVTAPAHAVSQIFLAGPIFLLRAATAFSSLIPHSTDLEQRLKDTLAQLKKANKWQSLTEYPDRKTEILHLAQMDLIDFSAHKGTPRFKTR